MSFIDDCSCFKALYPIKKKSDTFSCFQRFKAWAENLTGKKIKQLRDDKGGEYMSNEFQKFLDECGISRELLELDYVICHMVSRLTNLVMSWSQG